MVSCCVCLPWQFVIILPGSTKIDTLVNQVKKYNKEELINQQKKYNQNKTKNHHHLLLNWNDDDIIDGNHLNEMYDKSN